MRLSQSLSQTSKTFSSDDPTANAKLLTQAGFIKKESAGVYSFLPFGWRVMRKIIEIIREEMNAVEAQEVLMPALVPIEYWQKTGRDNVEIGFQPSDKYILGWSHEEVVTPMGKQRIKSYRDLPFCAFQIQTKFRNEARAKSGLMRGREFMMKDAYSFHANQADLEKYYARMKQAYFNVFTRCGLESFYVDAPGGEFTKKRSHEFQVLTEAGEDKIFVCEKCKLAWNSELEVSKCEKCGGELKEKKGAEVGNIFDLSTRFSEAFDVKYLDENGKQQLVVMGCYGIGVSRIMAVVAEVHNDEKGLLWPESIAPFAVHLVSLGKDESAKKAAEELYKQLSKEKIEVLFDEREAAAGAKFADADLIGIPLRVVVSPKTLEAGGVEIKKRNSSEVNTISVKELLKSLQK